MPVEIAGISYLTLSEVLEQVDRSRTTVWRWRSQGKIPPGRRYRDWELLFTIQEVQAIYAYANRITDDEAAAALKYQLKILF